MPLSLILRLVALLFLATTPLAAQRAEPSFIPIRVEGVQPTWAEHADGGEVPVVVLGVSVVGSAAFDILTAPGSARRHNESFPDDPPKSPTTALVLSLAGTVAPGAIVLASGAGSGAAVVAGSAGILLGPSFGHWYAGRPGRGWSGVGARAGLTLLAGALSLCCT